MPESVSAKVVTCMIDPFRCLHSISYMMFDLTSLPTMRNMEANLVPNWAARFRVGRSNDQLSVIGKAEKPHWRVLREALPEKKLVMMMYAIAYDCLECVKPEDVACIGPPILPILHSVPSRYKLVLHLAMSNWSF